VSLSVTEQARARLDTLRAPVRIFFRDDDAGWAGSRLNALLDVFAQENCPVDLAVIPAALGDDLACTITRRRESQRIGVHQHGYRHANHETEGRKCEFGPVRPAQVQHADLVSGMRRVQDAFGAHADPIFTPPWNRCTQDTVRCLAELGFKALSRDHGAAPLAPEPLTSIPVHVCWTKAMNGHLSEAFAKESFAGVMLHHATMDEESLGELRGFLRMLRGHPNARLTAMGTLIAPPAAQ
jgi:hypothetical protein